MKKPIKCQQDLFTLALKSQTGIVAVKEFQFHDTRKFRFDYAIHSHEGKIVKLAIECDGGSFAKRTYKDKSGTTITTVGGRHNSGVGKLKDDEKFNLAAVMGWRVLRVTPQTLMSLSTFEMIIQSTL
jgi:very-short-patch-repair endonuclease